MSAQCFSCHEEEEIITIDVGAGYAEDKKAQFIIAVAIIEGCHYNSGAILLLQVNELRLCHAFKLTGQKVAGASEPL